MADRVAPPLSSTLSAHLAPARRAEVAAIADLDAVLAAHLDAGAAAWPAVPVDAELYLAHLAAKLGARADEPADRVIRTMPADDLYLAAACAIGDREALAAFKAAMMPPLRRALAKLGLAASTIDETEQRVLVMLLVAPATGAPPSIAGYSGRGKLRSWVRSIGVRTGRRLAGVEQAAPAGQVDAELEALAASVDPAADVARDRYKDAFRAAFVAALGQLTDRQRNLLRQYHLDGLTIDQLAGLYAINRATAARWVIGARTALLHGTRDRLAAELAIAAGDVDSIIRLVRSQLELSMRELLAP
jgi:RNA polymerase sigma-70 factor, ECF subfamily